MDKSALAAILGLCALSACALAQAQHLAAVEEQSASVTARFVPVADGSIFDENPFDGFPDDVQRNQANVVFLDQGRSDVRAVIEFDLIGLEGLIVSSATLELSVRGKTVFADLPIMPVEVRTFSADGVLRKSDFHRGQFIGVIDAYPATFDIPIPIDVTRDVQRAISAGKTFLGFSLRTTSGAQIDFGSLEWGPPPALVVTFD
jgi:hypothetical protein